MVTLSETKEFLGITGNSNDVFLMQRIALAQTIIQSYCKRVFQRKNYTQKWIGVELKPASWWRKVPVKSFPVSETSEIRIGNKVIAPENYIVYKETGFYFFYSKVFYDLKGDELTQLEIDFTGGFEEIPIELKGMIFQYISTTLDDDRNPGTFLPSNPEIKSFSIPGNIRIERFDYDRSVESLLSARNKYVLDFYNSGNYFPESGVELFERAG